MPVPVPAAAAGPPPTEPAGPLGMPSPPLLAPPVAMVVVAAVRSRAKPASAAVIRFVF